MFAPTARPHFQEPGRQQREAIWPVCQRPASHRVPQVRHGGAHSLRGACSKIRSLTAMFGRKFMSKFIKVSRASMPLLIGSRCSPHACAVMRGVHDERAPVTVQRPCHGAQRAGRRLSDRAACFGRECLVQETFAVTGTFRARRTAIFAVPSVVSLYNYCLPIFCENACRKSTRGRNERVAPRSPLRTLT